MHTLSNALSRLLLLALVVPLLHGCATLEPEAQVENYIQVSSRQWAESVATGRTDDLDRILADDFVGTDPQGRRYDKARMLENTREAPKYFASNQIGPVRVTFFGNTAVAQGEETWTRHRGEPIKGRFIWTDTWMKRNGKWQIIAAQDMTAKLP